MASSASSQRKRVVLLGATGSIGENTLRVIAAHRDRLELVGIAARGNWRRLAAIAGEFGVRHVGVFDEAAFASARAEPSAFPPGTRIVGGLEGLNELARLPATTALEGKSLVPILKDPRETGKNVAFSEFPSPALREWAARPLSPEMRQSFFGPLMADVEATLRREHGAKYEQGLFENHVTGYSMRTDRYRFTVWVDRRKPEREPLAVEVYDHQRDPQERTNLAAQPANRALVAELHARWLATR